MVVVENLIELTLAEALRGGADDVSVAGSAVKEEMVRFSNNSVTVVKSLSNTAISIYIAIDKKRAIGSLSNPSEQAIRKFTDSLMRSCRAGPPNEDYTPLPRGPFTYPSSPPFDRKIVNEPENLVELAGMAIDQSISSGASRTAGSVVSYVDEVAISTSAGAKAREIGTSVLVNVRAFADKNASGHGLSCASELKDIDAGGAGARAGRDAKSSLGAKALSGGRYDVLLVPTVAADIFQHVGDASSAFSVDTGMSFLTDMIEKEVAVPGISLSDVGVPDSGIGGRGFDDEGYPTGRTQIIESGILKSYLHNSTTARKFQGKTTGNAGLIDPHPWNLEVSAGAYALEEMISTMRDGLIVTNNWYTRFQNLRMGAYSTIPRDASFLVEGGEIKGPVGGFRISDTLPRQLHNIAAVSKERQWIKWWEVNTPTLSPAILLKDVTVTEAVS